MGEVGRDRQTAEERDVAKQIVKRDFAGVIHVVEIMKKEVNMSQEEMEIRG